MTDKYISSSQQRILKVIMILAGNEVDGLSPGEIAKGVGTTASNTTRTLSNLKHAGLAEQIQSTERWRLSPRIVQISLAYMNNIDKAESRLNETKNRFTRTPN